MLTIPFDLIQNEKTLFAQQ